MASQLQIDANRQNAQKSTGPKTPDGKAAVSQNALTHGLTALDAGIFGEDLEEFDATRQSFEDEFKPVGPLQTLLVQQIVMAAWRLGRIRTLEGGLFQLRWPMTPKNIEKEYQNLSHRTRLAYLFLRDIRGNNALNMLGRYEARVERSFYRALRELQRLQPAPKEKVAKQSQSAPEPEHQQEVTPPLSPQSPNHQITQSPNRSNPPISELDDPLHEPNRPPLDGDTVAAVLTPEFAAAGGDLPGVEKRLAQPLGPVGDQRAMG